MLTDMVFGGFAWRAHYRKDGYLELHFPARFTPDRDNPRIKIEATDTESDIIRYVAILFDEVQDLARKIALAGLLPGERIIVTQEKGQWVALEGNRRICACKLLLSPQLVPQQYRKTFPKLTTATGIERIEKVDTDVAPDRRAAEPVLTLRHSEWGNPQMEASGSHAAGPTIIR